MLLHYSKRSLLRSLIIFAYRSFTTVRGQKNRFQFNSCESIKFWNIVNILALDVWGKRILICNNKIFILCYFSVYSFCKATSFHSGYVIKPPQPSSASYGAPSFAGHLKRSVCHAIDVLLVAFVVMLQVWLALLFCSTLTLATYLFLNFFHNFPNFSPWCYV